VPFIHSNKRKDFGKGEYVGLPGHGHEAQNYPQHQFASTGRGLSSQYIQGNELCWK